MILRLASGSAHALQLRRGTARWRRRACTLACSRPANISITIVAFVQAQQAVVDEHAGQLVADGAVDQRRGHARIDAARQAEDHLLVAHLLADARHRLGDVVAHDPVGLAPQMPSTKRSSSARPCTRVRDLGVELHAVVAARLVGHAGDRAARRAGHQLEARRQRGDLVAVAHPHLEHAVAFGACVKSSMPSQQLGVAVRAHLGVAELAVRAGLDLAALLHRHREHAVADAQHRHAQRPTPPAARAGRAPRRCWRGCPTG